jgi:hypothetical protein
MRAGVVSQRDHGQGRPGAIRLPFGIPRGQDQGVSPVGRDRQVVGVEPDPVFRTDATAPEVVRLPVAGLDVPGVPSRALEDVEAILDRPDRDGPPFERDLAVDVERVAARDAIEDDPVVAWAGDRQEPAAIGEGQAFGTLEPRRDPRDLVAFKNSPIASTTKATTITSTQAIRPSGGSFRRRSETFGSVPSRRRARFLRWRKKSNSSNPTVSKLMAI